MRAISRQPKPELAGELAPTPKGKTLIGSKPTVEKIWIISESPTGHFIATIRTCQQISCLEMAGAPWQSVANNPNDIQQSRAPNKQLHSFRDKPGCWDRSIWQCKLQDENIYLCLKITDFYQLSFDIFAFETVAKFANSIRFTGYYQYLITYSLPIYLMMWAVICDKYILLFIY
jgi:hypothetical protein